MFKPAIKMLAKKPTCHSTVPEFASQLQLPISAFLLVQTMGGSSHSSSNWVTADHVGDQDGVLELLALALAQHMSFGTFGK